MDKDVLPPLFAQARMNAQHILEGIGVLIQGAETHHAENCPGCKVDAALSAIERHVQDMEKALGLVVEYDDAVKEWDGIDALTDMNAKQIASHEASRLSEEAFAAARAALPAREKEDDDV